MTAVESPTSAQATACCGCWRPTPACLCEETRRPDWLERAACHSRHQPPREAFTPTAAHGRLNEADARTALRWCLGDPTTGAPTCPVRDVCEAFAHRSRDGWSILGGTTPAQRAAHRAAVRQVMPPPAAPEVPPRARRADVPPLTPTVAAKIRSLHGQGMLRGAIAEHLQVPYRHVVAVLGTSRSTGSGVA